MGEDCNFDLLDLVKVFLAWLAYSAIVLIVVEGEHAKYIPTTDVSEYMLIVYVGVSIALALKVLRRQKTVIA